MNHKTCNACGCNLNKDAYFEVETCHSVLDVGFSFELCPACHTTIVVEWLARFTKKEMTNET